MSKITPWQIYIVFLYEQGNSQGAISQQIYLKNWTKEEVAGLKNYRTSTVCDSHVVKWQKKGLTQHVRATTLKAIRQQ